MARIVWSREALINLRAIGDCIAEYDPRAATTTAQRLIDACDGLRTFPGKGHPTGDGVGEWSLVRPYITRYEIIGDEVHILQIRHGARRPQ